MAADAQDHLDRLPTELFCLVAQDPHLTIGDLAALAATSFKYYSITNPMLYQKHIKENASQACKRYCVQIAIQIWKGHR